MAGRRTSKINIDMFPFLSVLCSVIGVMMLLIVLVLSTRAENVEEQLAVAPAPVSDYVAPTAVGIPDEDYEALRERILAMANVLGTRQSELRQLNKLILQLEDLIATKEDESLERVTGAGLLPGVTLEKPEDVVFVPTTNVRVTKQPRFIEVMADEYVVQPDDLHFAVTDLDRRNSPLHKFLAGVDKARNTEYIVFLIHENGVAAFQKINDFVLENYPHEDRSKRDELSRIDMGKEPFSRSWLFIRQPSNSDK